MASWPKWTKLMLVCAMCIALATVVALLLEAFELTP
jgi:hypothetical protein